MSVKAEANLSALIESSDDPIWAVDQKYRLLSFNSAFQRLCERNFNMHAVAGMSPDDFPAQARGEVWRSLYGRALIEGAYRIDFEMSDGTCLELSFSPILFERRAQGVSVFGKDITDRRRAETALQSAEKRYRDLFDGAVEGMFQSSLLDNSRTVNAAYAQMLGYDSPEETVAVLCESPENFWDDPSERRRFRSLLERDGDVHGFECRFRRKDGSIFWVSVSSRVVFNEEGIPTAHHGFIKDITQRKLAELRLHESEERFRATFEQAAVGILLISFDGEILACNPRFASMLGYLQDELVGATVQQITPPDFRAESDERLRLIREKPNNFPSWEKPYLRKDGSYTWVRVTVSVQRDAAGKPLHHISFIEDINAQRDAEQALTAASKALQTSEIRYRTIFQTMVDAVVIRRASDGLFIEVNEAYLRITGFEREEVVGITTDQLSFFASDSDRQKMSEALHRNRNFRDLEMQFRKKNGDMFWGLVSASTIDLDGVRCVLSVIKDISDVKAAKDTIRDLAFFDPLTRLPNRRLMLDRLQQALATGTRNPRHLALLFVDLDNFKILNDTLGHQTGDWLLTQVALRLTASVRESDTVARLGGDEFVVTLDGLSGTPEDAAAQAKLVAAKIFTALGKAYVLDGRELHSQPSMGITVFGTPHRNPNEILQQAEIAMYQAKSAGRHAIRFYSPALQAVVNARAALEEDLRQAIKARQFVLYYQPQVDASGLIGAEVLIRWNHPTRGILAPGEFIPLAEETGLILELGTWALQAAFEQVSAWGAEGNQAHLSVAVNISARQFQQPDFVEQVLGALASSGANPINLKLELTESMLVENIDDIIDKMTQLRRHGLSFSLDDFGTGYSSLSYLKRLPLDQLKIDRAFVRDILSDVSSGAIAQTIVSLSRAMQLSVIAEGVETEGQRDFLLDLGCPAFQGYLYSRPLPVLEFERQWMLPAERPAVIN
jgi:diguanylate cyclase (GGDEF)-like protein/PAS domain S-box-containing protein